MTRWKLTDAYEIGYEYECPDCGRHIGVRVKGKDLPDECPYCGSKMTEITTADAIRHFEYGVSHDIFSEPVTTYAKMAISALREQEERSKGCEFCKGAKYIYGELSASGHVDADHDFVHEQYGDLPICPMCGRRLEEV